jgi:hypothetical protein
MPGDTSNCSNCGGGNPENDRNGIGDCGRENLQCNNPCGVGPRNSARCESLPSQIENFTLQFFGEVVKTEINGKVSWSLPCSLDVGLPNNPRGINEGLACYFLRLFHDGIVGLTGEDGEQGPAGANGNNAYSVTLAPFTQPTLASPLVHVTTAYNPALIANLYIFIQDSGWYQITATNGAGVLFLSLVQAVTGASGSIPAGKLVVPSGVPIVGKTGPQGPQGIQGPQGPSATESTNIFGQFNGLGGTDFPLPVSYAQVDFTLMPAQILIPTAGTYTIDYTVGITAQPGVATSSVAAFKLRNTSISLDVAGSFVAVSGFVNGEVGQAAISVIVTTSAPNQTIGIFGQFSVNAKANVTAALTTMTFHGIQA